MLHTVVRNCQHFNTFSPTPHSGTSQRRLQGMDREEVWQATGISAVASAEHVIGDLERYLS